MIIIFHALYFAINYTVRKFKRDYMIVRVVQQDVNLQESKASDAEDNLSFDPPVYKQRYAEIQDILLNNKWKMDIKRIVDFGCAEFKLFLFVKRLYRIEQILEVDIDEELLKENLFRIRPITTDYICKRSDPLAIHVFCGSISDPDRRLLDVDAVIGIEIIEHLYPDTLDALPYNIFGFINPKIAIFTTPNADFNQLFPNFKGFRHSDHKFEWSREQFESWAMNIISRFPEYSVSFKGVGQGPKGTENLGCCSQMAVFVKECDSKPNAQCHVESSASTKTKCTCKNCVPQASFGICKYFSYTKESVELSSSETFNKDCGDCTKNVDEYYKEIEIVEYPYNIDERPAEQKILDEIQYRMRLMGTVTGRFYNETQNRIEIPLFELIYNQYTTFTTVSEAREILEEAGFKLEECIVCDKGEPCVIYEPDMESRSSTPATRSHDDSSVDKEFYSDFTVGTTEGEASDWEIDSELQKGAWIIDLPNEEIEPTKSIVDDVVDTLVNNVEVSLNQEHNNLECAQKQFLKQAASCDEDGGTCSNEGNCGSTNVMHDSGYCKSNTNLTSSPQSCSDALDADIFDDHLNHANFDANIPVKVQVPNNAIIHNNDQTVVNQHNMDTNINNYKCEDDKMPPNCVLPLNIEHGKNFVNSKSNDKEPVVVKYIEPVGDLKMALESKTNAIANTCTNKANNLKDHFRECIPGTSDIKKKKKSKRFDSDDDDSSGASGIKNEDVGEEVRNEENVVPEAHEILQMPVPVIVENGDLANNNRDLEGNNYPNAEQADEQQIEENDNEHVVLENNIDNELVNERNEDVENRNAVEEEEVNNIEPEIEAQVIQNEAIDDNLELEIASREALYDPNSQVDLLEDFNFPDPVFEVLDEALPQNVIIVSLGPADTATTHTGSAIAVDAEPFPNWLLHLLGAEYVEDEEHHDEPHFYCQGDGIGVHPSFIEGDFEEEHSTSESDSNSSSSSETTATSNNDEAEAIPTVSEFDVGSLPDDVSDALTEATILTSPSMVPSIENQQVDTASSAASSSGTESTEEFFDSFDESMAVGNTRSEKNPSTNETKKEN